MNRLKRIQYACIRCVCSKFHLQFMSLQKMGEENLDKKKKL